MHDNIKKLFPFLGSLNVEKASARNMSFLANILTTPKFSITLVIIY